MFSFDWTHLFSLGSDAVMILSALKAKNPHMISMGLDAFIRDILGMAGADPANKFDKYPPILDELTTALMTDLADVPAIVAPVNQ